jgi:hypothetical protein
MHLEPCSLPAPSPLAVPHKWGGVLVPASYCPLQPFDDLLLSLRILTSQGPPHQDTLHRCLPLLALGCHPRLLKWGRLVIFLISGLCLALKNTQQLLLQPGLQDGIGDRYHPFGSNLSGRRAKQSRELCSSISEAFMSRERPERARLGKSLAIVPSFRDLLGRIQW